MVVLKTKQTSKFFFHMNIQVYFIPCQTEGRRRAFLEWKSIYLSFKLSLTCCSNDSCYKSVHDPISTLLVGKGNTLAILKQVNKLSFQLNFCLYSLLGQVEGEKVLILEGARREATL